MKKLALTITSKDGYLTPALFFLFAGLLIIGSSLTLWHSYQKTNRAYTELAVSEIQKYSQSIAKFRNFYTTEILPKAKNAGIRVNHNYKNEESSLPLPATFAKDFGKYLGDEKSEQVNLYSLYPFPWRDNTALDDFQIWALETLAKNPTQPVWRIEVVNGLQMLRFASADVMKESCVACHNNYPGTPKSDWKVGDIRGALEVSRPLSSFGSDTQNALKDAFFIMIGVLLATTLLFILLFRRLRATVQATENINKHLLEEIKHREKATKALERSELKTRTMINSVQEAIIVINKHGHIIEINAAAETIFGYKCDQLLGLNVSTLMPEEHALHHDQYIHNYLEKREKNIMKRPRVLSGRHRNGDTFPIELTVNEALLDHEIFFVGTIRDITHRRLAEKQIEDAHQAAVESAQLKSEFLANMSHEIRTPMNGVIGMTEMLIQSELNTEQRNLLKIVKDSAESLLVIINDILDFSKIEAGKLTVQHEPIKLIYTLESVLELMSEKAARKYVKLALFIDNDVPQEIRTDAGRLRQVLLNLISNALKFTEQGYVILKVTRHDQASITFNIIDSGSGIPEKAQSTLFDAFSQVDGSSSRGHGGTGLGLAISKQLVELMGGAIGVKSTIGEGSTFWFTLPAKVTSGSPIISANINVLMYCNNNVITRHYQHQMQQWCMNSDVVNDINHLFELLKQQQYDLVAFDADTLYIDPNKPQTITNLLKDIRSITQAPIVLYASYNQYQKLDNLSLDEHIKVLQTPIKHTDIQMLLTQMQFFQQQQINHEKPNPSKTTEKTSPKASLKTQGIKILLAEDNRVNQKVASFMLKKLGYETDIAVNGLEVLEKIQQQHYHLIFMDCQMPEMDGYEATRTIRAMTNDYTHAIPIIALTAHAMKSNDTECYAAGMNDYLTKPVRSEELEAMLSKWQEKMLETIKYDTTHEETNITEETLINDQH